MRNSYVLVKIDRIQLNSGDGDRDETITHIIRECSKLAQKEYETTHEWVGEGIHWELGKKMIPDHRNL